MPSALKEVQMGSRVNWNARRTLAAAPDIWVVCKHGCKRHTHKTCRIECGLAVVQSFEETLRGDDDCFMKARRSGRMGSDPAPVFLFVERVYDPMAWATQCEFENVLGLPDLAMYMAQGSTPLAARTTPK